jgi:hypothetical protein
MEYADGENGREASMIGTPLQWILGSLTLCPIPGNSILVGHVAVATVSRLDVEVAIAMFTIC